MNRAFIVDAVRTPIGTYGGSLSSVRADDLAALVLKALLERNSSIDKNLIDDVILGCTNQAGEDNRNVARMALLLAGLPVSVPGVTVNRLCASGLQAVINANNAIKSGDGEIYLSGGVESMSRAPFVIAKSEKPFDRNTQFFDTTIGWRFINKKLIEMYFPFSMGETAENVAEKWKITREAQDEFAFNSQMKYKSAKEGNRFDEEIVPVRISKPKEKDIVFSIDEHPRTNTSKEKLAALKPAFKKDGTVTAGNSSGINDGASALLIVSEGVLQKFNLTPLAEIVASSVVGVDPAYMGIGPVPATEKLLKKTNLKIDQIDLVELNEAFASQSLACVSELNLNTDIVNVNGGAIALGHPLGCSGARIVTTLVHELRKRNNVNYGIATMCVGVGQGSALLIKKC